MNTSQKTSCPLCNSENTNHAFRKDDIDYSDCKDCNFRFSTPDQNSNFQENIDSFEEAYISYFDDNSTDELNLAVVLKWAQELIDFKNKNVLDIGSGGGKLVRYLHSKQIAAQGIEPSKPLYDKYLKGNPNFYFGDLSGFIQEHKKRFEIVFAQDVLEHVIKPKQFIQQISTLQEKGDFLILEIPLKGSIPEKILGRRWHFYHKYHISYFTKKRLEKMMNQCGYTLVLSKYRGKYFLLQYLFKYLFDFVFRTKNKTKLNFGKANIYLNMYDIYFACFKKTK